MANLRRELIQDITAGIAAAKTAGKLNVGSPLPPVIVKQTDNETHGNYSSPIALALAKQIQKPPLEIVEIIVDHMPKKEYMGKLEEAAPGFLNITISPEYLASRMDDLPIEDLCASCNVGNGKSINMEFISANPTGPLTLGNARTAFTADTLGNVLACAGYNVVREYYLNDAGEQIRRLGESVLRRIVQQEGHSVPFADDLYQGEYIFDIAKKISEQYKEQEGKKFDQHDLENAELLEEISNLAMEHCLSAIKETIANDLRIYGMGNLGRLFR